MVFSKIESFWGRPHFEGVNDTGSKPRAVRYADTKISRCTSTIDKLLIVFRQLGVVNNPTPTRFRLACVVGLPNFLGFIKNRENSRVRPATATGSVRPHSTYLSAPLRVFSVLLSSHVSVHNRPTHVLLTGGIRK